MHPILCGDLKASQGRPDNCPMDPGWTYAYKWDPEPSPGLPIVEAIGSQSPAKAPNGSGVQAAILVAPGPRLQSRSPVWPHSPGSGWAMLGSFVVAMIACLS